MKFIIVRHCETDWNKEWRLQGHADTSLNENGWIQADELAEKLKNLKIKKIVSSDLKRSRETAGTIYGGESRDAVLRRHLSILDELSENNSPEPTLLIGHGTGMNTLLTHLKKSHIQRGEYVEIEYSV